MGQPFTRFVLFDTSTLAELSARCDELQARSAHLQDQATRLTQHIQALDSKSVRLILAFDWRGPPLPGHSLF